MKITSGRLVPRYSMALSAFSALSTSISYFSRIRDRNTRADFESSTISARLAPMRAPRINYGQFSADKTTFQLPNPMRARKPTLSHGADARYRPIHIGKALGECQRRPGERVFPATLRKHRVQAGIFQHPDHCRRELFHTFGHYQRARAVFQHEFRSKL